MSTISHVPRTSNNSSSSSSENYKVENTHKKKSRIGEESPIPFRREEAKNSKRKSMPNPHAVTPSLVNQYQGKKQGSSVGGKRRGAEHVEKPHRRRGVTEPSSLDPVTEIPLFLDNRHVLDVRAKLYKRKKRSEDMTVGNPELKNYRFTDDSSDVSESTLERIRTTMEGICSDPNLVDDEQNNELVKVLSGLGNHKDDKIELLEGLRRSGQLVKEYDAALQLTLEKHYEDVLNTMLEAKNAEIEGYLRDIERLEKNHAEVIEIKDQLLKTYKKQIKENKKSMDEIKKELHAKKGELKAVYEDLNETKRQSVQGEGEAGITHTKDSEKIKRLSQKVTQLEEDLQKCEQKQEAFKKRARQASKLRVEKETLSKEINQLQKELADARADEESWKEMRDRFVDLKAVHAAATQELEDIKNPPQEEVDWSSPLSAVKVILERFPNKGVLTMAFGVIGFFAATVVQQAIIPKIIAPLNVTLQADGSYINQETGNVFSLWYLYYVVFLGFIMIGIIADFLTRCCRQGEPENNDTAVEMDLESEKDSTDAEVSIPLVTSVAEGSSGSGNAYISG